MGLLNPKIACRLRRYVEEDNPVAFVTLGLWIVICIVAGALFALISGDVMVLVVFTGLAGAGVLVAVAAVVFMCLGPPVYRWLWKVIGCP